MSQQDVKKDGSCFTLSAPSPTPSARSSIRYLIPGEDQQELCLILKQLMLAEMEENMSM